MLKKAITLVACLALGTVALQTDAFAHGGHSGGHHGGYGGHYGGYHHHRGHGYFRGFPFVDFDDWPYADDDCYWTRTHRYVCD